MSMLHKATITSVGDPRVRDCMGHSLVVKEMGDMRDMMRDPAK